MKEAMFYTPLEDDAVQCFLCAQKCRIKAGKRGKCGVRENRDGKLWSLVYGKLVARHTDPIEKKPLFHFLPGTRSYSIATAGCNFRCLFCQNADISQGPRESGSIVGQETPPGEVVDEALATRCASVSYTYTEPTIFMEYALDVCRPARENGLLNVFVTNGFMSAEALEALAPFLDAANVDLKAFRDDFYKKQCGARLAPVLRTLEDMKRRSVWLEVTTLLIPGLNDDEGELGELAAFLASLGPETVWHVSRFHPTYRMLDRPPTPVESVRKARRIGLEAGLKYVYTGNAPGDDGENTYCPSCGLLLVERRGFSSRNRALDDGRCSGCGASIDGVGWNRKAGF